MIIDFVSMNENRLKLIPQLSISDQSWLLLLCVLFLVELFLHILVFVHLLIVSGISSVVLAITFASICGYTSFGIWVRHSWSLIPRLYVKWFKNNSELMKYVIK